MKIEKIKPIPQYMLLLIEKANKKDDNFGKGFVRFYCYFTKNDGELTKVTVACKNKGKKWFCKQVAVHGIHSKKCFVKDLECFMVCGYVVGWYEQGLQRYRKWYETENWCEADDKYYDPYAKAINPEFIFKFPEYKYSAIDKYKYCDTFKYLRLYERYPHAELLVKFGLNSYATSKQILHKTVKDKAFRKWLINNRDELKNSSYYISTILLAYKTGQSLRETQISEKNKKYFCKSGNFSDIKALFTTSKEVDEFLEYMRKQSANLSSYQDYLKACRYLELDMSLSKNRLPHNFKYWHDIRIDEYHTAKALRDEQERKELYHKFAVVADKYLPLQRNLHDAFIVIIARSPAELIKEGDILHHCVGRMNYDQRMIREESLIFFIRNFQEPDVPFVTLEYSLTNKKVLQCYGEHDHKPSEQVLEFVNKKWLPYANRKLKKIAT